jgi:hypothetical protein
MVGDVPSLVESELAAGGLACPSCEGVLRRWGHARERPLQLAGGAIRVLRPRRAMCGACGGTHVLLADVCLVRRRDEVAVIGEALRLAAGGMGHRQIARRLGVLEDRVRGWVRRLRARAAAIRAHFLGWAVALDPVLGRVEPAGGPVADAVEAIGVAARAWQERFGSWPVWRVAARLSGGGLLANTNLLSKSLP